MMQNEYLAHHGVKGMKWGVRRTPQQLGHRTVKKWGSAKNQPSSAKSSALAGLYAATGNERVGRALDRSNARDASKYKQAKAQYKASSKTGQSDKSASRKQMAKRIAIGAAVVGGTALAAYGAKKYYDSVKDNNYKYHAEKGKALTSIYLDKNKFRDQQRAEGTARAMKVKSATGYTSWLGLQQQDADERLRNKTMARIYEAETRKAQTDTFRQARANAKAYKAIRRKDAYVPDYLYKQNRERYGSNFGRYDQDVHSRRRQMMNAARTKAKGK